ncbi:hypothetical protein O4H51_21545 [Aeromonas hydrophila]|uniref:hypothetical protein n=1 Tax=Aeromonas hydrophila TaxID=644 RepID=UPI0022AF816E|nr:hypothetical protein [Aeromonas hydrophila]MCZ4335436.1 hypothetical protein [Aeromonas hydrophila]
MEHATKKYKPFFPLGDAFDSALSQCIKTNLPIIKGIHEPTGSGKTYSAAKFAVDAFLAPSQTIPIYIAPIKRLVEDFEIAITDDLKRRGLIDIPIYRLYAWSDFANDESILDDVIPFCSEARKVLYGRSPIEDPFSTRQSDSTISKQTRRGKLPEDWVNQVEIAVRQYQRCREWAKVSPLDAALAEQMSDAMNRIWSGLSSLCVEIVRLEVVANYSLGYVKRPALRQILLKLMPANLFVHTPGIIVATASKFVSQARVVQKQANKLGVTKVVTHAYDSFFEWAAARDERFCLLVDEEEEAYSYIFNAQKKELTNRDVDLHRVVYAFFHHFDLGSLANYADTEGDGFARQLFDSTGAIVAQLKDIKAVMESGGSTYEQIDDLKKLSSLASFSCAQLKLLMQDFFGKSDVQNGFKNLKQKLLILEKIKKFIIDVHKPWPEETSTETPFDVYRRLQSVLQDKKKILAGRQVIKDLRAELEYLFFNEQLELFDHAVLEQVRVVPSIAHRNLELVTASELRQEIPAKQKVSFSLGEFLRFIMMMTRILFRTQIPVQDDNKLSRISDDQWKVLYRYRQKIGHWRISPGDFPEDSATANDPMLTETLVFKQSKFALSIVEDVGRKSEYSTELRIISITATVLRKTPEDLLATFLRVKEPDSDHISRPGNITYLMSATGGMTGCWGGYNLPYLRRKLASVGSVLLGATSREIKFMQDFRCYRAIKRNIHVADFDADPINLAEGIQPGRLHKRIEKEFLDELNAGNSDGRIESNPHKCNEIRYIAALISRLACGQERSAMAFTQTVEKFKGILNRMAIRGMGVETSEHTRGLYIFDPSVFGVQGDPIRIIAYTASFGKNAPNLIEGQFREVTEANGMDEDVDESVLSSLLDETNYKVLFVSSFRSAARGLNLTLKHACPSNMPRKTLCASSKKDFDILMVAMSPYYDSLYRPSDDAATLTERLQAMLQYLYLNNTLGMYHYRDLPQAIADGREEVFRPEYYRKIGRELIQTIGRAERVEGIPTAQYILLNREVVYELVQFYRMEPEFSNRLSAGNHAVFQHTEAVKQRAVQFQTEQEWEAYVRREVQQGYSFLMTSTSLHRGFRNSARREAWEQIRNPLMFTDPAGYLHSLQQNPSGMSDERWRAFVDYAFLPRSRKDLYLVSIDKAIGAIPNVEKALGEDVIDLARGRLRFLSLITDLYHTDGRQYKPEEHLIPPGLRSCQVFMAAIRKADINLDMLFVDWIPRPQFFMDYVKGYFAEMIFTHLISSYPWVKTINVADHPNAKEIYERFDVFIGGSTHILAIDLKNWGRRTDRLIGRRLREAAPIKSRIVEEFLQIPMNVQRTAIRRAKFVEKKLGPKAVIPVYLNLCGTRCSGQETLDGKVIRFFNLFVAERDDDGWTKYSLNQNFMALVDSIYRDDANV